jgi:hypothetical protein
LGEQAAEDDELMAMLKQAPADKLQSGPSIAVWAT